MKTLILAEKPSVGRDLARVLGCHKQHKHFMEGPRYVVTWALGHLVELKMPEDYDPKYRTWRLEDLPIIPEKMETKIIRQTSAQFKAIKQLAKRQDLKELVIATDAGREGELVARWIIEKIHWKKPVKRLWISSQTDQAIKNGFKQLKPARAFNNLYQSAVCRAEADWLIGLNVTRALTTKYDDPLSAGRVQTPTLMMALEREKEIQSFVPRAYWTLVAHFPTFKAVWEKNGNRRLFHQEEAERLYEKVQGQTGVVRSVRVKEKTEPQPLPYDLTELQREANRRFGFSAKKTLSILQRLYEHYKLVTYPRTDSRYLTKEMANNMAERLRAIKGAYPDETGPLFKQKPTVRAKRVFNDQKVTDHHGIIPTEEPPFLSDLTEDERKIYDLVARRFLALFYPPSRMEVVHAVIEMAGETLTVHETILLEAGFKTITGGNPSDDDNRRAIRLQPGQRVVPSDVTLEQELTEPPARFTEGDLLGRMETYGLGTAATRADIIERLLETEVVERQSGRLIPTRKGEQLIDLVNDALKSPELTARWERELEAIARGKGNPEAFLANIRQETQKLVREIKTSDRSYRIYNLTGSKCPTCGAFLKEVNRKDGKFLVCSNRECRYKRRKDPVLSNRYCPQCRKRMELHHGKAGKYFQCRPCNIVEKEAKVRRRLSKGEEDRLLKKYSHNAFANSMADALKAALEEKKESSND